MGVFDRFRQRSSTARPPSNAAELAPDRVREEATRLIRPGFRTRAEVRAELIELIEEEGLEMFGNSESLSRDEIASIVDDAWSERLRRRPMKWWK